MKDFGSQNLFKIKLQQKALCNKNELRLILLMSNEGK